MTLETFKTLIKHIKSASEKMDKVYSAGIDISDLILNDYFFVENLLLSVIYTEEGVELFNWSVYENDFCEGNKGAWELDGTEIKTDLQSTWEQLEKLKR